MSMLDLACFEGNLISDFNLHKTSIFTVTSGLLVDIEVTLGHCPYISGTYCSTSQSSSLDNSGGHKP